MREHEHDPDEKQFVCNGCGELFPRSKLLQDEEDGELYCNDPARTINDMTCAQAYDIPT